MKIMAVLAVLLISALFMGAASAAIALGTEDVTLTASPTTVAAGETVTFTLTNNTLGKDISGVVYSLNYTTDDWVANTSAGNFPSLTAGTPQTFTWTAPAETGDYVFSVFNQTAKAYGKYNATAVKITVTPPGNADREVSNGDNAFVYEHIYIPGATKLVKYSDGATPSVVNQISGTSGVFYLTEAVVNGQYGTYNVTMSDGTDKDRISIWYPELSIQAELTTGTDGSTSGDSIEGKSINKNTFVTFLLNTPLVGPENAEGKLTGLKAKIVFTTPAGGKTTDFGVKTDGGSSVSYSDIPVETSQKIAAWSMPGTDATAGTYTAQAEFTGYKPFADNAKKSNTISFTVQSTTLTLSAAKDSVVRSNPFTVTLQGDSQMMYFVYLDGASASDVNPVLQQAQSGMKTVNTTGEAFLPATYNGGVLVPTGVNAQTSGYFETDASGKRVIQYNTNASTEDKTYTVKVYALGMNWDAMSVLPVNIDIESGTDYDSVKVKVEKGAVTISASGDGSYYIGDEIKLTGTNTDSSNVFLFITGPNLLTDGVQLKEVGTDKDAAAYLGNSPISVKTDNTWEYKWDTSKIGLDTGAYTVYATSVLTNGKASNPAQTTSDYGVTIDGKQGKWAVKLSDSEYATVSVNLKQPFLSAVPSGTIVAKGDKIYIRGTAEGDPSYLQLYIFGPNKFVRESITVEDDGTYEKKLDIGSEWASNQYYVVIEHPMYNNEIDVSYYAGDKGTTGQDGFTGTSKVLYIKNANDKEGSIQSSFVVEGANKLQGSNAANALTQMIDSANIDDIYTKLTFTVAEPVIKVTNPGDQAVGTKFTISGTTNLAVDDQILVEVMSSSFSPTDKTSTDVTSGVSQTTKVVAGDGTENTWSVEIDTTNWKLDEYTIKAQGIEVDITDTTNFNLVEKVVTPTPTATSTGVTPTTTATATATATPSTPGFGAFIALAGLGAVALLVLRRN